MKLPQALTALAATATITLVAPESVKAFVAQELTYMGNTHNNEALYLDESSVRVFAATDDLGNQVWFSYYLTDRMGARARYGYVNKTSCNNGRWLVQDGSRIGKRVQANSSASRNLLNTVCATRQSVFGNQY
jgi:hypothetical protein